MTNLPANKDYFVQIYAEEVTPFRILDNGTTIYEGKAYARPNTSYANINITKILENYVYNALPTNFGINKTTRAVISNAYQVFEFDYLDTGGTWTKVDDFGILAWYDYESKPDNYTDLVLSDPVNGHSAAGVNYVRSRLAAGIVTNTITTAVTAGYDESYCGRYGITYLNQMGGYDFFLFEGKYSKSDGYNRFQYNRTYDNNYNGFGLSTYQNEITTTYTLSTGWLNDEESYRFAKHVVGSNQVWLQDLETGKTTPVQITDKDVNYKKYEGKELICYTLTVINSQEQVRK